MTVILIIEQVLGSHLTLHQYSDFNYIQHSFLNYSDQYRLLYFTSP